MIHTLTRITIVLFLSTSALVHQDVRVLSVIFLISALLVIFKRYSNNGKAILIKMIRKMLPLIISIFIIQLVFNRMGTPLVSWKWILITQQGLDTAVTVTLRLMIILLSGAWLWGISPREFNQAFRLIRLPETLAVMITMTLRFLPVLIGKVSQSTSQLRTRGIILKEIKFNKKIRLYINLIIPILGWTMKDISYQAIALDIRGFRNGMKHTCYQQKYLGLVDYMIICLAVIFIFLPKVLLQN